MRKPLPTIPGYTAKVVRIPGDFKSSDTKVVYVKNDQKQVLYTVMKQVVQPWNCLAGSSWR